ncbi:hypothetical protein [Cupriavidus campinensis]|uniref:Phage MuF C-terminal domain-containing protein n=1 Tax=Cupriavidus campinensis TaxID=151783 RepID=A0ABY3ETT8_9BURK|nr:hypothetical protein [Cupriavidus campinensis]TSP13988.1 hypothetical protein FGG12_05825 [Cupriavidus campinensis]
MKNNNYELVLETTCAKLQGPEPEKVLSLSIELGSTPELYCELGFPQLPLAMRVTNLDKILFRHGIPIRILKGIYGTLLEPKAVFRSHTHANDGNAVVLSFEEHHLGPVVIILHANIRLGRDRFVNEVKSIYAKENPDFERMWRKEGLLLWEKK